MYHPTTRVLTVLELLQAHGRITGPELAERLEVDVRTARRYVTMLQDLGIPVEAERGRYGGYALRPGFKLPPLMFTEDEALALTLGLLSARKLMLAPTAPAIEGALAKVERVLPDAVRARVQALQETVTLNLGEPDSRPDADVVATLGMAAQQHRRVHIGYRSAMSDDTERDVDPYGLAYQDGRWYLAGRCHLRGGLRTFRLDRVTHATLLEEIFERPAEFDTLSHVLQSLAAKPGRWPTEVLLHTTLEDAREMMPSAFASLTETPEGVVLRANIQSLPWMARFVASLGCSFVVRQPAELRDELRRHAAEIARLAASE
jgi:predicted DNA-binding transcriptional regulator YafY